MMKVVEGIMSENVKNKKTVIYILLIAAIIIIALAVTTIVMFAAVDKDAVTEDSSGETSVSKLSIDDSSEYADSLFACAVTDINDSASVVKLLETMKFEDSAGEYTAQISAVDGVQVLDLNLSQKISKGDQKVFNENIGKCAQQMLALIPGIERVQWTYSVDTADASKEEAKVSIDAEGATKELGSDVRAFGESASKFQKLLSKQKNVE